jgi:hypothetical protein
MSLISCAYLRRARPWVDMGGHGGHFWARPPNRRTGILACSTVGRGNLLNDEGAASGEVE